MSDPATMKPQARRDELIVDELPGELLIYDLRRHRAHCLNESAALVWRLSDGTRTVGEIAGLIAETVGAPEDPEVVLLALERLRTVHLLDSELPREPEHQVSRRSLMRRLTGVGRVLLIPAILSVPTQAQAAIGSCVAEGTCITGVNDCSPCFNGSGGSKKKNDPQCAKKRCWQGRCRPDSQTPCP